MSEPKWKLVQNKFFLSKGSNTWRFPNSRFGFVKYPLNEMGIKLCSNSLEINLCSSHDTYLIIKP